MSKLFILITFLSLSCSKIKVANNSLEGLPEIGDCLIFQSLIDDSNYGLILYAIDSNIEETSYMFCIVGEEFESPPTAKQFKDAGIIGRKIATGSNLDALLDGSFQENSELFNIGFSMVSIEKENLSKMPSNFKKIDAILILSTNRVNADFSMAENLEELEDVCSYQIIKIDQEPPSAYMAPVQVFPISMMQANDNQELQVPETRWIISKKSAHPTALQLFKEDFYWDTSNEFAPFGSDEGFDTVHSLKDWLDENPNGKIKEFLYYILNGWGVDLGIDEYLLNNNPPSIPNFHDGLITRNSFDYVIIAGVFGKILIDGSLHNDEINIGMAAIDRQLHASILEKTIGHDTLIAERTDILLSLRAALNKYSATAR